MVTGTTTGVIGTCLLSSQLDPGLIRANKYLSDHGWNLNTSEWEYNQLKMFAESVRDLKQAAGWSTADYKNTMTSDGYYNLELKRQSAYSGDSNRPADVVSPGIIFDRHVITMRVYDALFKDSSDIIHANLVHELAHVWDASSGGKLSRDQMNATGSYYSWLGLGSYVPVGGASSGYYTYHYEDWAETVAAAVYPTNPKYVDSTGKTLMGSTRRDYIRSLLPKAAIFGGS